MTLVGTWGRRVAVGALALLALGFGVGTLAKRGDDDRLATGARDGGGVTRATRVVPGSVAGGGAGTAGSSVVGNAYGADAAAAESDRATGPGAKAALPPLGERVIRNGDISIEVERDRFEQAWAAVGNVATQFGGLVSASSRGSGGPQPVPVAEDGSAREDLFGTITLRVPARSFDKAMAALRKIGDVASEVSGSTDVSEEYVDLQSRRRHLRAQEAVLLRLMRKAQDIDDTIVVQNQLSDVQLQIEEITGRLRFLDNQTSLSTITVNLAEPGALAGSSDEPSFSDALETAIDGLQRIGIGMMLAAIWIVPFALAGYAGWRGARRLRRRPAPQV